jgi:thioredoxin
MEHLTKESFKEKIFDFETNKKWKFIGDKPTVIDFYADWCGPCKMIVPTIKELEKEYLNVDFYKIDIETEVELVSLFKIQSIPSILFIPIKNQPQMVAGALSKKNFEEILATIL